nr:rho GTPase-activating protein 21 isoform X6 [Paramormyrops kingsleyae]
MLAQRIVSLAEADCTPQADSPWARSEGPEDWLSESCWVRHLNLATLELEWKHLSGVVLGRQEQASNGNCDGTGAKRKDAPEQSEEPSPCEEEPFSWPGPKTLRLRRTSQGFGFTLRHFIVYPPESAVHFSLKDEDNGGRGRQRSRLEPMDTIFVKQVKEGGPAHGAGLCTGDRIVKVNGESIIGKTYSQVIALIQNSDASLELCVMPKDEDILQLISRDITALAYSQDAYLKGNDAYSGNARNIPEPPPLCYPRIDCIPLGMAQTPEPSPSPETPRTLGQGVRGAWLAASVGVQPDHGYCMEIPVTPSPPEPPKSQTVVCVCSENVRTVAVPLDTRAPRAGPSHRTEENRYSPAVSELIPGMARPIASPAVSPSAGGQPQHPSPRPSDPSVFPMGSRTVGLSPSRPDPHTVTPRSSTMASMDPSPVASNHCSPSSPASSTTSPAAHQNIDWRNYTTYKEYMDTKRLYMYGCRTIQERLDSLRAASQTGAEHKPRASSVSQVRRRSTSHDRAPQSTITPAPPRSASQERLGGPERTSLGKEWPRSASQDALASTPPWPAKPRARSCDYLSREGFSSGRDRQGFSPLEPEDKLPRFREAASAGRQPPSTRSLGATHRTPPVYGSDSRLGAASFRNSPLALSFARPPRLPLTGSTLAQAPTTSSYVLPLASHLSEARTRALSLRELTSSTRTYSVPAMTSTQQGKSPLVASPSNGPAPQPAANGQSPVEGEGTPAADSVVLRKKPTPGGLHPLRHPSYILAVNEPDAELSPSATCWLPNDARREVHMKRLGGQRKASNSSNLGDSLDSIPFIDEPSSPSADHDALHIPASAVISVTPTITMVPPSPTSPTPVIRRQLSHDQDSLRLTILESDCDAKTERSKSCDEGLDNYKEEGRGSSLKSIAGLRALRKMTDRSSDDSGSQRDSTSEVFSDATKEGLLHFRQLSTDKSKRVGGGMRPWKQMYAVLRGHSLCLYKDRKEGLAHANSQSEDEPQPISIKACLIDISYSDTKRKNVLRLTTSDCEYLFQAEDREDMLSWIRVIQQNSNLDEENEGVTSRDLISRRIREYNNLMSPPSTKTEPSPKPPRQSLIQNFLGGKGEPKASSPHSPKQDAERKALHKDDNSPPKDKSTRRKGIPGLIRKPFEKKISQGLTFGVRLDDCPPAQTNPFVPLIVEVCCKLVEERGLEYTGIYRVPGNNAAISSLQEELNNKGLDDIDIQDDKWKDLNVISSLLKSFFRKLPEPLFTNEKYGDFIDANRLEDATERLKTLKRLLHELPSHHYETLKFLSAHLKTVAENSEKNKMEPRNLAIVFGPTLVRSSEDNMTHMVTHMPDQYKIVETLIQHYDWFFTEDGNEEPMTAVQQENTVECQPVPNIDHLLTNIGRTGTSPGDVSDSASDSAKSKGSWGSGKDLRKDLPVSCIFAAANRKRKNLKEKLQPSSSDDDLDGGLLRRGLAEQDQNRDASWPHSGAGQKDKTGVGECQESGKENGKGTELAGKMEKDHWNSFLVKEKPSPAQPSPSPSPSPRHTGSPSFSYRTAVPGKSSLSEPSSLLDEIVSDLGTMSSQASVHRVRQRKRTGLEGRAGEAATVAAEVSSITSDYSTTSSMTFLMGADGSTLSPEVRSVAESRGDEADDERSELVSEGRPVETDSESDFSVFAGGSPALDSEKVMGCTLDPTSGDLGDAEDNDVARSEGRCLFSTHKLVECDTLSRRRSLRQKTDSESSEGGRSDRESNRLSRVLEVMKKGRSGGSLSTPSRAESEKLEPAWKLKITERLKFRLKTSADDMFGVGTQKAMAPPPPETRRKKNVRRRHTMGGQRDFAELAVIGSCKGRVDRSAEAELSAMDRLKPKCSSQDFSIREWIARERCRGDPEPAPDTTADQGGCSQPVQDETSPATSADPQQVEQANGGGLQAKNKQALSLAADAHPHKLSGAQVVRSRFYQYL